MPCRCGQLYSIVILCLFLTISTCNPLHAQSILDTPLYQEIITLRDSTQYDKSIDKLNEYLDDHKNDVDALFLLGNLEELQGTQYDKMDATKAYERALDKAPHRTDICNALARLYYERGFYDTAAKYYNYTLKQDYMNYTAVTQLIALHNLLGRSNNVMKLKDRLIEIAEKDPDNVDLLLQVARMYVTTGERYKAQEVLLGGINKNPEEYRIHKELADMYITTERTEEASEHYLYFLDHADQFSEELLEAFQCMQPILTSEEQREYRNQPDSLKGRYLAKFWRERDPYPVSVENEHLIEYLQRLSYVMHHYRAVSMNVPYDDRGRIYIKHGQPDEWHQESSSGAAMAKGNESWYYKRQGLNMYFDFVDRGGFFTEIMDLTEAVAGDGLAYVTSDAGPEGNLEPEENEALMLGLADGKELAAIRLYKERAYLGGPYSYMSMPLSYGSESYSEKVMREVITAKVESKYAESYFEEVRLRYPKLTFALLPGQFRSSEGRTELWMMYGIPTEQFRDSHTVTAMDTLRFQNAQILFDNEKRRVYEEKYDLQKLFALDDDGSAPDLISEFSYLLDPGNYTFTFQFYEQKSKRADWKDIPLNIRQFPKDDIAVSDIVLASDIEIHQKKNGTLDLIIRPNPFQRFHLNDPVFIYFEVYNLFLEENEQSRFTINLKIEQQEDGGNFVASAVKSITRLLTGGDVQSVESMYERSEPSQEAHEYLSLDMSDLGTGQTRLTVTITDEVAQRSTSRSVDFEIE